MGKVTIMIVVAACLVVCAGLGVLIWWLVTAGELYEIIRLEENNFGEVNYTAAFTRVQGKGDMFWWFYPTLAATPTTKPLLLWLHGVTGESPSYLANFGIFGPYDINLKRRNDSLVNEYNLLFVDAPVGTGFSTAESRNDNLPSLEENIESILNSTNLNVTIYNGNLDAVSNTPGQLEWINNLNWPGQNQFLNQTRVPVALNGFLEGYSRISDQLRFYWINVAGLLVPLDSPLIFKELLDFATTLKKY